MSAAIVRLALRQGFISLTAYNYKHKRGYKMTRKDYVMLAEAFASQIGGNKRLAAMMAVSDDAAEALEDFASYLADQLAKDNPRFDRERFLQACGVA